MPEEPNGVRTGRKWALAKMTFWMVNVFALLLEAAASGMVCRGHIDGKLWLDATFYVMAFMIINWNILLGAYGFYNVVQKLVPLWIKANGKNGD